MKKRIICIEGWQVSQLRLSGNKLVLYALIWQNSNHGKSAVSIDYTEVSEAMGTTIPTMYNCLKDLCRLDILVQVGKCEYRCNTER
jgi:hypothetical protein